MKRKKREEFSISKEYKKSWAYVKESRNFIYAAVGVFVFFVLVGYFIPAPQIIVEQIRKLIEEVLRQTEGMSMFELIGFIFFRNALVSFIGILFGILFGVTPLFFSIENGYVLGFVSKLSVQADGFLSLWRILPHGIFELPAVFISLGLGIKLGTFMFQKKKLKSLKDYLKNSLRTFLLIILPLLIVAGIIEGTLIFLIE